MLYVKTAGLKSCCFSQTHKSKSKSHLLLSCTSSLLFNSSNQPADIHLFQDWKKVCINYRTGYCWRQVFTVLRTAADFLSDYIWIGTTVCLFHMISSFTFETHMILSIAGEISFRNLPEKPVRNGQI